MYRSDLFEDAGLTMPEQPTWDQIAEFAMALHDPDNDQYGVILKGIAQYGQLAPFMSYTYAHGLRWFDEDWQPQFTTPGFMEAAQRYVDLVQDYGEPGASTVGFVEGLGLMSQGQAAIWVDATVAAGLLADPANSTVTDKMAYAMAPEQGCDKGHWLYSWNLAIAAASQHPVEAAQFILWATSKDYIDLVAETNGWEVIPPGTRISTYERPEYLEVAPWAELTLRSIETADEVQPSCLPTPYTGSTQVDIPEWPDIAFDFAQDLSAAVAGTKSVEDWLSAAQEKATEVLTDAGYIQ
jgi:sorbitol/mannitol transport system substrate-binding protein